VPHRRFGGNDAVLVIDDTAIPKKGTHSVGVAPQYASALGKTSNCRTLVSLTLARGEVPVMLALRLFVSASWTSNRARLERGPILAGPSSSCVNDDDRSRFPSASPARKSKRGKKNQRAAASTHLAGRAPGHPRTHRSATVATMRALRKMDLQRAAA
jgi:hypothetical protein